MNAIPVIIVALAIIAAVAMAWASLKCHAWGWCPTCREFWSDSGEHTPVEPLTAVGPVLHDHCPRCAEFLANTQNQPSSATSFNQSHRS